MLFGEPLDSARELRVRRASSRGAERRRHTRIERPPLVIDGLRAIVVDVSHKGIGLILDAPVTPGQRFNLCLTDVLAEESRSVEAEVTWCSGVRAGLRWVGLAPEREVWIHGRFNEWLQQGERWVEIQPCVAAAGVG